MASITSKVLVICGPTSTGKTSLGIEIAKSLSAVIISADSRQIYKNMNVGTGKIPISLDTSVVQGTDHWLVDGVKIFGYDLVSPHQAYSAFDFSNYARKLIVCFQSKGIPVLVVGGTGYYIDTLTGKLQPSGVAPNMELREELNKSSLAELGQKVKNLSLDVYNKIDAKNKVRLIRAIEKLSFPDTRPNKNMQLNGISYLMVGLKAPNEFMYKKADFWVDSVWEHGLVDETRNLLAAGYESTAPLNGLIYKSVRAFLNGDLSRAEAIQRTKYDIHSYIRRQLTWFKRNTDINWYDISILSHSQIKDDVMGKLSV